MKPYRLLTERGKLRRLRRAAMTALSSYDLDVRQFRLLTVETNTFFRIDTQDKAKYVLRVYSDEETTLEQNVAELYWLNALLRDTDLHVVHPVRTRSGSFITVIQHPAIPRPLRCVVFQWMPGRPLERCLSPARYSRLGTLMATLHLHAESLDLPHEIKPKRWDRMFYYPDEPIVYDKREYNHLFTPRRIAVIERVITMASGLLDRLYADKASMMLIHGDMHFWNVNVYRDELYLFDFEDTMLGYPLQDVAITLSYGRDREIYPALRASFEEGYRSVRSWPVDSWADVETLIAARSVNFINYVARIDPDPGDYVAERCARLEKFLAKYG